MTSINDPVGSGLVQSLSRPGGNVTGVANLSEDITVKYVDILRDLLPEARRHAIIFNPENPSNLKMLRRFEDLLDDHKIYRMAVTNPDELEREFASVAQNAPESLVVLPDFMINDSRYIISALALSYCMPTITNVPEFSEAGALISYGPSRRENYRRSATFVKRIVDGALPAALPVEQSTAIKMSINLATARALGIEIPPLIFALADEVIE